MVRSISNGALCVAILLASGCTNKPTGPVEVPVKGQVTLDGKPMAEGQVMFAVQGLPPSIFEVQNGNFSGNAKEGSNKVQIRAFKKGPPMTTDPEKKPTKVNYLPARYNDQSTLTAEVKAGGPNDFKFEVTSK